MALVRTVLSEPRFDPDALERARRQAIAGLEQSARNPNQIAGRQFNALAFGTHPYGRPVDGTLETVANLSREEVVSVYRNAFARDRVVIGAAGDISADELASVLDALLSELPVSERPLPDYAEFGLEAGITVIDHPGPQSVVQFGHAGLHRDDPDFMAAFVMNEILGGGRFGTRLMSELREQRGLTYGVGTSLVSAGFGDSLQGRMSTDNSRAAQAIAELRRQWEWLAEGGITQTDLDRAQTFMTGAYPLRFDGNGAIASVIAGMQFQGFDIDYANIRNDLVRAVTLEDIHRVSRRLARPEALHFIVVGRPDGLEAPTP
jgi:zinc protease